MQDVVDLLQDGNVLERGFTEEHFASQDVGVREGDALGSDLDVAFLERGEAEHDRGFDDGQQVIDVHGKALGEAVQVFAAAAVVQNFEQAGDASGAGMRQHLIFLLGPPRSAAVGCVPGSACSTSGCVMTL